MISTTWGTDAVPVAERAEALRQTIREQLVHVELELPSRPEHIFADVTIRQMSTLQVSSVLANPAKVRRTPRHAQEDEEPVLFISLQVSGESTVIQDGRAAVLQPGNIALYDTRRPYTLLFHHGVDMHFFRVPVRDIALPDTALRASTAKAMGASGTVSGLTAGYLAQLAAGPTLHDGPASHLLAAPTLELIRAGIAAEADAPALAADALHKTLALRIMHHMRARLAEPGLTPASVAAAHHISVRHLYNVLARSDICFGSWLRTERLEACRRELSRYPTPTTSISALAHRWGFKSASHFSRIFKAAYGRSPRAWRAAAQAAHHARPAPHPQPDRGTVTPAG